MPNSSFLPYKSYPSKQQKMSTYVKISLLHSKTLTKLRNFYELPQKKIHYHNYSYYGSSRTPNPTEILRDASGRSVLITFLPSITITVEPPPSRFIAS